MGSTTSKGAEIVRPVAPTDAFESLRTAIEKGHPIIPLFGSGMSVAAGFPLAVDLCNYLVRLRWWLTLTGRGSVASYLRSHNWPSRHNLTVDLLGRVRAGFKANADWARCDTDSDYPARFTDLLDREEFALNRDAIFDELRRDAPTAAYAVRNVFDQLSSAAPGADGGRDAGSIWGKYNEATGKIHTYTGYRSLLNYLCDRDTDLIDAFFDHFARDRRLSTTHQFIAFAAAHLGCRLILTTNFDTFVESALREEGMRPTVFEIGREGSPPSAQLVHSQGLSVVKLHGGAFSLRTGFDLDERLTPGMLAQYREYFRPTRPTGAYPIVLALGYSGSDRRVMDILSTHLLESTPGEEVPRIVWVSRKGDSPSSLDEIVRPHARSPGISPAVVCQYRDGGHFLHDLYQMLTNQHPVGRHHYRVLTPIARISRVTDGDYLADDPNAGDAPRREALRMAKSNAGVENKVRFASTFIDFMRGHRGLLFNALEPRSGSSSRMSKACQAMEKTHTTIWIDAAEVRTRASLFTIIERQFHPYDNGLVQITRPLLCLDVDYFNRDGPTLRADGKPDDVVCPAYGSESPDDWIEKWEATVALRWVTSVLRRGRYTLAIDSMGEFASGHPAMRRNVDPEATDLETTPADPGAVTALDDRASSQVDKAFDFVGQLMDRGYDIGESKVLATVVPPDAKTTGVAKEALDTASTRLLGTATIARFPVYSLDKPRPNEADPIKSFKALCDSDRPADQVRALVITLACFSRRGRSHASMITLLAAMARVVENPRGTFPEVRFRKLMQTYLGDHSWASTSAQSAQLASATGTRRAALAIKVAMAAEPSSPEAERKQPVFLVREEGGFYWMHQATRDGLFAHIHQHAILQPAQIALVFDKLANFFHDDVYERSQDAAAFMEYFFHRMMSVRWQPAAKADHEGRKLRYQRASWLVAAVELERSKLLARGRPTTLLNHIRSGLVLLVNLADIEAERDPPVVDGTKVTLDYPRLISRLLGCHADLLLSAGHAADAVGYRCLQALLLDDRVRRTLTELGQPPTTKFRFRWVGWVTQVMDMVRSGLSVTHAGTGKRPGLSHFADSLLKLNDDIGKPVSEECGHRVAKCQTVVGLAREVVDLMTDFALALGEPMLVGPAAHAKLEKRRWETDAARQTRLEYVVKMLDAAEVRAKTLREQAASQADIERLTRARVQRNEFRLRLIDPYLHALLGVTVDQAARVTLDDVETDCSAALIDIRGGPDTSRRRRHKSYLFMSLARAKARPEKEGGNFDEADVHYRRAAAALARSAGAAERNALGIVYLYHAEMLLARNDADTDPPAGLAVRRDQRLRECELLLRQAWSSMEDEARTENRWRTFYWFLSARVALARIGKSDTTDEEREVLYGEAMRHVVTGATNTGFRSDRRLIFHKLMKKICEEILDRRPPGAGGTASAGGPPGPSTTPTGANDAPGARGPGTGGASEAMDDVLNAASAPPTSSSALQDDQEREEENRDAAADAERPELSPGERARRVQARAFIRDLRERSGISRLRHGFDEKFYKKFVEPFVKR
jgi:hypothetical protein